MLSFSLDERNNLSWMREELERIDYTHPSGLSESDLIQTMRLISHFADKIVKTYSKEK